MSKIAVPTLKSDMPRNIILGGILVIILFLGLAYINSINITALDSKTSHFWLEVVGFVFATYAGFAAYKQLKITQSSFYLYIALAFFINGFEDLIHAFAAIGTFGSPTSGQSVFIPATWTVGRLILGLLILLAVSVVSKKIVKSSARSILSNYFAPLALIVLAVTTIILLFPIPAFILIKMPPFLHRPYELLAIVPLIIALPLLYRRMNGAGWCGTLLCLSVVVGIFTGVYMMNSLRIFDVYFNWAHILKDVSYFIFALALMTTDHAEQTLLSQYRFTVGWRLTLAFATLTLIVIMLVITIFALENEIVVHEVGRYIGFLAVVTILFVIIYPTLTIRWIVGSLHNLIIATEDLSRGKLETILLTQSENNEFGDLRESFERMRASIKILMEEENDNKGETSDE
ncbi:MAG: hypothetical protein COB66_01155 [Coxiella sp. (in: Bacteria)]|nr:MAG: hypothetical protein COB66_01155 [Coxiella sp. (in: g-proteobacteria)]